MITNSEHQIVLIIPSVRSNQFISVWRYEFWFRAFIIAIPNTVIWVPIPNELPIGDVSYDSEKNITLIPSNMFNLDPESSISIPNYDLVPNAK